MDMTLPPRRTMRLELDLLAGSPITMKTQDLFSEALASISTLLCNKDFVLGTYREQSYNRPIKPH